MPHNYLFFWYFLLSLNGWKNFHRKRTSSLLKFRCQSQIKTKKKFSMTILNDTVLESNKYLKLNFGGGDLSSDAGLLLIKEFACKLGFVNILKKEIKTNDSASFRFHKDDENLWQIIYQILGAYFEDDCADELTNDPILTAVLAKNALASQPTLSRFFNRLDDTTLNQFYDLMRRFRKVVYSIKKPEMILLALDSTLLLSKHSIASPERQWIYQAVTISSAWNKWCILCHSLKRKWQPSQAGISHRWTARWNNKRWYGFLCGLLRWISVSGGNVVNLSPKALIFQGYRALFFCENFCFFLKRLDKSLQKWGRCSDKLNHT